MSPSTPTDASPEAEVTALLRDLAGERPGALHALLRAVQGDLRRVAHFERLAVHGGETLSTTALVNEAYLKLSAALPAFADRRHFYTVAARAMRQILIDHARAQLAQKRGGGAAIDTLGAADDIADDTAEAQRVIELDDAIERLALASPRAAQTVQLRFFAGLSDREIGALFGVDESTVRRDWLKARGWLYQQLRPDS
jgi:RNA polymerase sigma factor (TIGR02999 family)